MEEITIEQAHENTRKFNWNISTGMAVFLNQMRANVCEHITKQNFLLWECFFSCIIFCSLVLVLIDLIYDQLHHVSPPTHALLFLFSLLLHFCISKVSFCPSFQIYFCLSYINFLTNFAVNLIMPSFFSGGMLSFMLESKKILMRYSFCIVSTILWH